MFDVQLNNSARATPFLMVSSADNYRGVPGLSPLPVATISKDCGPFQPALGQVVEMGNGWYGLLGHVQDRNTLGALTIHGEVSDPNVQCIDPTYRVVPWNPDAAPSDCGCNCSENSNANTANLRLIAKVLLPPIQQGQIQ